MSQSALRAKFVERAKKIKPRRPKFEFGRHKGKTLTWVEANDPAYIDWVKHNVAKTYWPVGLREAYERVSVMDNDIDPMDMLDEIDFHGD